MAAAPDELVNLDREILVRSKPASLRLRSIDSIAESSFKNLAVVKYSNVKIVDGHGRHAQPIPSSSVAACIGPSFGFNSEPVYLIGERDAAVDYRVEPVDLERGNEIPVAKTLQEICCEYICSHFRFAAVEYCVPRVTAKTQALLARYSFPKAITTIYDCCCLSNGSAEEFTKGMEHYHGDAVENVQQIGFHVLGDVKVTLKRKGTRSYKVTVMCAEHVIQQANCSCTKTKAECTWCSHIVAVVAYRIFRAHSVPVNPPISETLTNLNRNRLVGIIQFLIQGGDSSLLGNIQCLVSKLAARERNEEGGNAGGSLTVSVPDKTAGPVAKSLFWGLDERKLSQRLATLINDVVEVVSGRLPSDYEIFGEAGSNNLERFQELCGQNLEWPGPRPGQYGPFPPTSSTRQPLGLWHVFNGARRFLVHSARASIEIMSALMQAIAQHYKFWRIWEAGVRGFKGDSAEMMELFHSISCLCDQLVQMWILLVLDPSLPGDVLVTLKDKLLTWQKLIDPHREIDEENLTIRRYCKRYFKIVNLNSEGPDFTALEPVLAAVDSLWNKWPLEYLWENGQDFATVSASVACDCGLDSPLAKYLHDVLELCRHESLLLLQSRWKVLYLRQKPEASIGLALCVAHVLLEDVDPEDCNSRMQTVEPVVSPKESEPVIASGVSEVGEVVKASDASEVDEVMKASQVSDVSGVVKASEAGPTDQAAVGADDKPSSVGGKPSRVDDKPSGGDDKPSSVDDKPSSIDDKSSSVGDKPSGGGGGTNQMEGCEDTPVMVSAASGEAPHVCSKETKPKHDRKEYEAWRKSQGKALLGKKLPDRTRRNIQFLLKEQHSSKDTDTPPAKSCRLLQLAKHNDGDCVPIIADLCQLLASVASEDKKNVHSLLVNLALTALTLPCDPHGSQTYQVHRLRAERTLGDLVVGFCKRFGVAEVVPHEERFLAETKFGRDFAAYPVSLPFTLVHTLASVRVCTEGDKEGMRVPNRLSGHTYDVLKVARRLLGCHDHSSERNSPRYFKQSQLCLRFNLVEYICFTCASYGSLSFSRDVLIEMREMSTVPAASELPQHYRPPSPPPSDTRSHNKSTWPGGADDRQTLFGVAFEDNAPSPPRDDAAAFELPPHPYPFAEASFEDSELPSPAHETTADKEDDEVAFRSASHSPSHRDGKVLYYTRLEQADAMVLCASRIFKTCSALLLPSGSFRQLSLLRSSLELVLIALGICNCHSSRVIMMNDSLSYDSHAPWLGQLVTELGPYALPIIARLWCGRLSPSATVGLLQKTFIYNWDRTPVHPFVFDIAISCFNYAGWLNDRLQEYLASRVCEVATNIPTFSAALVQAAENGIEISPSVLLRITATLVCTKKGHADELVYPTNLEELTHNCHFMSRVRLALPALNWALVCKHLACCGTAAAKDRKTCLSNFTQSCFTENWLKFICRQIVFFGSPHHTVNLVKILLDQLHNPYILQALACAIASEKCRRYKKRMHLILRQTPLNELVESCLAGYWSLFRTLYVPLRKGGFDKATDILLKCKGAFFMAPRGRQRFHELESFVLRSHQDREAFRKKAGMMNLGAGTSSNAAKAPQSVDTEPPA